MEASALLVLFKYEHVGSSRRDEWLLLCPENKILFARRTRGGRRAFGAVGTWCTEGNNKLHLQGFACCLGANTHDLCFHKSTNKMGEWNSAEGNVCRTLRLVGWCGIPPAAPRMLQDAPTAQRDGALLAIADASEQVVEGEWLWV